jgi:predicted lysophospholipase L1 biosynthesis ABC-type transport system permease subunit
MSLAVTAVVALVLFAGVVVIAKRLPITDSDETTGAAPARDLPAPKASERAVPARPD